VQVSTAQSLLWQLKLEAYINPSVYTSPDWRLTLGLYGFGWNVFKGDRQTIDDYWVLSGIRLAPYWRCLNCRLSFARAISIFLEDITINIPKTRHSAYLERLGHRWRASIFDTHQVIEDPVVVGFLIDGLHGESVAPLTDYLLDKGYLTDADFIDV
jgi:hypothetical protein